MRDICFNICTIIRDVVSAPHLLRNYVSDINETFTICSSHTGTQNGRVSFESVDYYKSYFGRIIRNGYISLHVPWPNSLQRGGAALGLLRA